MKLFCNLVLLAAIAAVALSQDEYKDPHRKCYPPKRPEHGGYDTDYKDYSVGHKLTYYCDDGYDLHGSKYSTCGYSDYDKKGYWDKEPPYCKSKKKPCPKLRDPPYGSVKQSGIYPGDGAWYSCDKGFELMGNRHRICQKDGTFSGDEPICKPIECGDLSPPKNGSVKITSKKYKAVAVYDCDRGYRLKGDPKRFCQYDGKWSGHPPVCKPKGCGYPPSPGDYGETYYSSTGYGSKVRYACYPGYYLYGPDTLTCLASGRWSGKPPVCHKHKDCKDPYPPKWGIVNVEKFGTMKRAVFHCKHGYILVGEKVVKCLYNGKWSHSFPVCKPVDCGYPPEPNEYSKVHYTSTVLHSMATYSCKHGYKLVGSKTVKCMYFGKWSDKAPVCKPIDCGCPYNPRPHSSVNVGSTTLGSKATYTCDHGYNLVGMATVKCQYDKKWSDVAPLCEPVDCGSLPAPDNGAVEHVPHTLLHSLAKFSCDKKFKLVGEEVLKCEYNGEYNGKPPVCKPIKCPDLTAPEYGEVHVTGNHPGDYAKYRCDYGYGLEGSFHRFCDFNGDWTGVEPKCVRDPYMLHSYDKKPNPYGKKDPYGHRDHDRKDYDYDPYDRKDDKKDYDPYGHDKKDYDPYDKKDGYGHDRKDYDPYDKKDDKKGYDPYGHDKKDYDPYDKKDGYGHDKKDYDPYDKKDGYGHDKKDYDPYDKKDGYGHDKKDYDPYDKKDGYGHDKKDYDPYDKKDGYGHDKKDYDPYDKKDGYGHDKKDYDPYDKKDGYGHDKKDYDPYDKKDGYGHDKKDYDPYDKKDGYGHDKKDYDPYDKKDGYGHDKKDYDPYDKKDGYGHDKKDYDPYDKKDGYGHDKKDYDPYDKKDGYGHDKKDYDPYDKKDGYGHDKKDYDPYDKKDGYGHDKKDYDPYDKKDGYGHDKKDYDPYDKKDGYGHDRKDYDPYDKKDDKKDYDPYGHDKKDPYDKKDHDSYGKKVEKPYGH